MNDKQQINVAIAVVVIALLAIGAVYLITRVSSVRDFGGRGDDSVLKQVQNGDFDSLPSIESSTSAQ